MSDTRVFEIAQKVQERLDFGPNLSRLLLQVVRQLARGHPLSKVHVNHIIADLGIAHEEAQQFLRQRTAPAGSAHGGQAVSRFVTSS